jgi:uncharacterized protein (DUF885 family)
MVLLVSPGPPPVRARQAPGTDEAATLRLIVEQYMGDRTAGAGGLRRGLSPDWIAEISLERSRRVAATSAAFARRLGQIDSAKLTHNDWITYGLLQFDIAISANADKDYWLEIPIAPYSSPLRGLQAPFASFSLLADADLPVYVDALAQVPIVIAAYEAKLRAQLARGIVLAADEISLAVPFIRTQIAEPPRSGFSVTSARLGSFPAAAQTAFQQKVDALIRESVNPSISRLVSFIDGPYRARAPSAVGLSQYPGGREYYQHLIKQHTGLDLTPEQIHQIGLAEVDRLNRDLDKVRTDAKFAGDLQAFRTFLKTDPQFFAKSSNQIGDTMMAAIRLIEPKIGAFFAETPHAPYGVKRLDEALEQSMTYGYYQVPSASEASGFYRFNGSQPESRSLLMAAATIYHELIPGHHFQLALRSESTTLSTFRRSLMHTAFTEGWAEYSSDLAGDMGMYDTPYKRAGRLAMDLFLSTRLVVDTGMNALGWSRQRAIEFMRANTLESDVQIGTETLRYSSDMPGQALAYKLGSRAIHEARDKVKQAQGSSFDMKRFHAYLLDYGSMPLGVLDGHVACFISEKHRTAP